MPITNNLLKRLFHELSNDRNLTESKLLSILAEELVGTLNIVNSNLWKINSFNGEAIKKNDNDIRYATLLGCYGYTPVLNNAKEFVHDLTEGVFGRVFDAPINDLYYEFSLAKDSKLTKLHIAPKRIEEFQLDRLIVIPMTYRNTAGYSSMYILNLYVHPYEDKIPVDELRSIINSIKEILQFGLQNKRDFAAAKLVEITMGHFEEFTQKNKDTASILNLLIDNLRKFIKFDACSIFMWDPIYHQLALQKSSAKEFSAKNSDPDLNLKNPYYYPGVGKTGKVYQTGIPIIIDNINNSSEKDAFQFRENTTHELRSFMAIPIIHPARPSEKLGVIRLVNRLNHYNPNIVDYFSYDDYRLIKDFASLLALHLEVEQSEKIRTAFAKHMEHEIESPIISTRNDAFRILAKRKSGNLEHWQLTNNLERIIENANLLMSIIKNVQYTWKGSEGIPRSELYDTEESINFLDDILKPAREMVVPLLRTEGFPPNSIQFEGQNFKLCIDKEALRQVFINLLSNAIKYRDKNNSSQVLVTVKWAEHNLNHPTVIEVIDYGRGIAKENIERVFHFGFREKDALAISVRGLGIGLSVVKKIISDFYSHISIMPPPISMLRTNPTIFRICLSTKLNSLGYTRNAEWKVMNWR